MHISTSSPLVRGSLACLLMLVSVAAAGMIPAWASGSMASSASAGRMLQDDVGASQRAGGRLAGVTPRVKVLPPTALRITGSTGESVPSPLWMR